MVEHGNKHRRNTVEAGDLLLIDAGQRLLGGEIGHGTQGRAMGHGGGHGEGHAEAVEHGNLHHHAVGGGQTHAVADALAVVDHVVVGEHNALGEAGGAAGVLHVAHVMGRYIGGQTPNLFHRYGVAAFQRLLPGDSAGLFEAYGDDIAQEGQTVGMQLLAFRGCSQFGTQLVDDLLVVAVAVALLQNQRMRIGLFQQILRLMDFVGGVHGYQHRADLGGGPEGDVPLRQVGSPHGHMAAGFYAKGDQRTGKVVHVLAELSIGAGIVEGGVFDGQLVGEFRDHAVKHAGEGHVDELILLPHIAAVMAQGVVEGVAHVPAGIFKLIHVGDEMGEDDLAVVDLFGPFQLPHGGDIAVVIDGRQSVHQVSNGQRALADGAVFAVRIGIAQMHMADVGAEVLDGLGSGFLALTHGVVHIPDDADLVTGKMVHELGKAGGIGIDAGGLDEHGHALFLGNGQQGVDDGAHVVLIVAGGVCAHVGHAQVGSGIHELLQGFHGGVHVAGDIDGAVKAGYRDARLVQGAHGGGDGILMEGAAFFKEGLVLMGVIDLYAGKVHVFGCRHPFFPCAVFPAAGGKAQLHASTSS